MYNKIASNKRKSILMILIFIVLILLLGYVFGTVSGYGYSILIFAGVLAIFMPIFSYFKGDSVALWSTGAKKIEKKDNPYVYRMTENLCITAGIPLPNIYIMDDPAPNAFATGRDPKHASIALTAGIINTLKNEELEGVIAHELSHIQNYDIRLMTIVIALVGIVVILADMFTRHLFWGRRDNKNNSNPIFLVVGITLAILSPLIASLIQFSVSRKREFLADASGALLTRYPEGLANALKKISSYDKPMKKASNATAYMFISNPFGKNKKVMFEKIFSTHPPIEERVKELNKMM